MESHLGESDTNCRGVGGKLGVGMLTIDRSQCEFGTEFGGYSGVISLGGRRFDVFVKAWDGDWEAAWSMAQRGIELLFTRFSEIEAAVASQLAPELDHWTEEVISVTQITERVVRAMNDTAVVGLRANEEYASLFFDGPPLVLGHRVEVAVDQRGQVSVGLAG